MPSLSIIAAEGCVKIQALNTGIYYAFVFSIGNMTYYCRLEIFVYVENEIKIV